MTPSGLVPVAAARQLLSLEGWPGAGGPACLEAADRVHQRLVSVLGPLLGVTGVQAILARSVRLATGTRLDTSRGGGGDLHAFLEAQAPAEVAAVAVAVYGAFLSLVVEFIGGELTLAVLRRAWPALDPGVSEESTK